MKTLTTFVCLLLFAGQVFAQRQPENWKPVIITPTPHDPNFKSRLKSTEVKSFYKSKADWQLIIDTTWGLGLPLEEKLIIFDAFTDTLTRSFIGFNSQGIDPAEWEQIKASYRSKIDSSTSRGAFSSLMSHLAYNLKEQHTFAWDDTIKNTTLNPGIPVLLVGLRNCEHFGAVLTLLPDSSIVVLSTLENHPLGLEPGDLVLGYEGIPWKVLIDELLEVDIPMVFEQRGAKSARRHSQLTSAGMNWHLFDTIDIVKYTSGDTVHLAVDPLLNLPVPTGEVWISFGENMMWNNEQLPVPGVPMLDPNDLDEKCLTYGIIEGTNIGYIYLYVEFPKGILGIEYGVDEQFYEAFSFLKETEGLIIDLRLNFGGGATFDETFKIMFNEILYTVEEAYRCSLTDFNLCPANYRDWYVIPGQPMTLYDRPLALLVGPNCISMGELIAHYFRYHPMVRYFGKPTGGSIAHGEPIYDFPDWTINYSIYTVFHINNPGVYLFGNEFCVDDTTWFDRDGVANGEDAVANKAIEWIQNLSHAHDVKVQPVYVKPEDAEITLTAEVENPNSHMLSVYAKIESQDKMPVDSIALFDDGGHGDGDPGDGTWGALWTVPSDESIFKASVSTEDTAAGTSRTLPNVVQFTTMGPVVYDGITFVKPDTVPNSGDIIYFKVTLRNNGASASAVNITVKLTSLDALASILTADRSFADIAPGELSTSSSTYKIAISADCPANKEIPVKADISSDGYIFWSDTFSILVREPVSIEDIREPLTRIYPNPIENILNIELNNADNQPLKIEIFTVTGEVIYQKDYKNIAAHFVEQVDLSGCAKGIYLVKVKQDRTITVGKVVVR
jgi:hypothetical protein